MDFISDFFALPLKKKIFVFAAIGGWIMSIQFSVAGFDLRYSNIAWLAWGLGALVTILELALNDRDQKPTISLVIFGFIAYGYGITTNIMGIWAAANGNTPFTIHDSSAWIAVVVGLILECVPEPLLMLAYGRAREADPLGILSELFSGKLMHGGNKGQNQPKHQFEHSSSRHEENPRWQNPKS